MKSSYAIAAILAAAAVGWVASGQLSGGQATPESLKPPADLSAVEILPLVRVRRQIAEPRTTDLVLRGRTTALRNVHVKAETFGRVVKLNVEKGMRVKAGDVLARLSREDRPARLTEAEARLEQRRIEHEAAARLAKKGFRAATKLAAAAAELKSAQAAVTRARVELDNTVVRAPFDGIVDDRLAEIGDYLDAGDAVARVVDLDPILVVAQVNENHVGRLTAGQPGRARLVTGEELEGTLRFIASVADAATHTFRVELEVANPDATLLDGVTAELRMPLGSRLAHLVSPAILTLTDRGVVGVMLLEAGRTARFHPVEIIDEEPRGVWLAGLPEEVTFITVGQEFVTDAQRVRPIDEETLDGVPARSKQAQDAES